ncbi:MAG: hypothetical protein HY814_12835, partial [Candidatus Riflebacteria bacterium]|nr:hypothetical protein [Candidatus Riflebacteria bacterium]
MISRPTNRSILAAMAILLLTVVSAGAASAQARLTASRVESPGTTSAVAGDSILVDGSITNAGATAAAASSYYIRFFLVADGSADITLGAPMPGPSVPAQVNVEPGFAMVPTSQTVPASVIPGVAYRVAMRLSAPQQTTIAVPEVRSAVTILIRQTPPPSIDLTVMSVMGEGPGGSLSLTPGTTLSAQAIAPFDANVPAAQLRGQFWLSTDRTLNPPTTGTPGDFAFGPRISVVTPVPQGMNFVFDFWAPIPATVPAGTYYLLFNVNPDHNLPETNFSNNVLATPDPISYGGTALPDLHAMGPVKATTGPVAGQKNLSAVVHNPSQVAAGAFESAFVLSTDQTPNSTQVGSNPADAPLTQLIGRSGLAAGASTTITAVGQIPAAVGSGEYYVLFLVDPAHKVAEANEDNNVASSTNKIRIDAPPPSGHPDLVAVSVNLPTTITAGIWEWSATVQNASSSPVGPFEVGWALSANETLEMPGTAGGDIGVAMITVQGLAAHASTVVTTRDHIPFVPAVGRYYVFFGVDPDQKLPELNEQNNLVRSQQTVFVQNLQPLTDLLAESV